MPVFQTVEPIGMGAARTMAHAACRLAKKKIKVVRKSRKHKHLDMVRCDGLNNLALEANCLASVPKTLRKQYQIAVSQKA